MTTVAECLLTLNAGSSSIKFALFAAAGGEPAPLAAGQVEGLGTAPVFKVRRSAAPGPVAVPLQAEGPMSHRAALSVILAWIEATCPDARIGAVGHRVVHGGSRFEAPVAVDEGVLAALEAYVPLAPLHQPHNLSGIRAAQAAFPAALQVACFDTAFHRGHPYVADTFALPRSLYDEGLRRYGFHGLSYEYVARRLAEDHPALAAGKVVVAHLGNGASMCALNAGRSVASTMGFTALDGLPMGTRCGQLDPGAVLYLMQEKGMTAQEISDLLYNRSGLKGLSGVSSDMRDLEACDRPQARRAIAYFVDRIRHELGGLAAALSGLDALVFTGGIGENAFRVREAVTAGMDWLGIVVDRDANAGNATVVSTPWSRVQVLVLPTDEEAMIARHTLAAVAARSPVAA
ncbi:acetate/propionate family kinase [Prosthecomicrobium sp. N25]|uniref:acetate/propionate family kinase n=1 Tax=Prosthecomicrobium sp. N25 TaxID=3129254 RepID=UPI003077FA51